MSRRKGAVLLYVIVGYGFTWTVWLPYVLAVRHGEPLPSAFTYYVAALGPILGAVAGETVERGPSGIRDLLHRLVGWRRPGGWVAVGLVSPLLLPPVAALAVAVAETGGPTGPGWGSRPGPQA